MKVLKAIRSTQVSTGWARRQGMQPSHDGEYVVVYYVPGSDEYLATDNGGVAWTYNNEDCLYGEPGTYDADDYCEADEVLDEIHEDVRAGRGEVVPANWEGPGGEACDLMVSMGWIARDEEE